MTPEPTNSVNVLELNQLCIQFGGLKAVKELTLTIKQGQIFGLIGPNGAGKTTVFNLLTGVYQPTSGSITSFNRSLVGLRPFEITRHGVVRTFQNIRLFKELTVEENLLVALDQKWATTTLVKGIFRTASMRRKEVEKRDEAKRILKIFDLDQKRYEVASSLPYGAQRRLEIARAIAAGAKLLLLDEPAAGMNAQETASLMNVIRDLRRDFKLTVLLIEHDMKLVMGICERIAVIDYGEKIAEGTPQEIQHNPKVIEAYLGKAAT